MLSCQNFAYLNLLSRSNMHAHHIHLEDQKRTQEPLPMSESDDESELSEASDAEDEIEELINPPERFGDLLCIRKLGQGAFGVAFLAVPVSEWKGDIGSLTGPFCVVKRFWDNLKPEENESAFQEIELAIEIEKLLSKDFNPYVLRPLNKLPDPWNDTIKYGFSFEYCDRGDLAKILDKRQGELFDSSDVISFARELITGLDWLHRNHIIHRDLSARNIFGITDDNGKLALKIGDYGLAKLALRGSSRPDTPFNSPKENDQYGDPDQHHEDSPKEVSDVYALGIILLEIMMGRMINKKEIETCLTQAASTYPELVPLVRSMVLPFKFCRPSISEVLEQFNQRFPSSPVHHLSLAAPETPPEPLPSTYNNSTSNILASMPVVTTAPRPLPKVEEVDDDLGLSPSHKSPILIFTLDPESDEAYQLSKDLTDLRTNQILAMPRGLRGQI